MYRFPSWKYNLYVFFFGPCRFFIYDKITLRINFIFQNLLLWQHYKLLKLRHFKSLRPDMDVRKKWVICLLYLHIVDETFYLIILMYVFFFIFLPENIFLLKFHIHIILYKTTNWIFICGILLRASGAHAARSAPLVSALYSRIDFVPIEITEMESLTVQLVVCW